jgi:hypothetical protein
LSIKVMLLLQSNSEEIERISFVQHIILTDGVNRISLSAKYQASSGRYIGNSRQEVWNIPK